MDNPDKLTLLGKQDTGRRQTKTTTNTICVRYHYTKTTTNNVNKTRVLLQTTRGKDKPNFLYFVLNGAGPVFAVMAFSLSNISSNEIN